MKKTFMKAGTYCLALAALLAWTPADVAAQEQQQQGYTITGKVLDEQGEPVIGATVKLKGDQKIGVVTDLDGNFKLDIGERKARLVISFLSMETMEVSATSGKDVVVTLRESTQDLDEVVVIGYGTSRRGDLTGAISSVNEKVLRDIPLTSAAQAITGKLAGVLVTTTDGSPDADVQILVRGGGSITQDNSPLYIVDGFQVDNINDIPVNDIQSIDVLKDASSTAIYGAKGANGVILVTTKSGKAGRTEVTFNSHVGFNKVYNMTNVLSPYEYYLFQREVDPAENAGLFSMYGRWEDRDIYLSVPGNDWQDIMYGDTGIKQSYNIGVQGGSEDMRFSISYTRDDEDYVMVNSDYLRDNLQVRLNKKLGKKLELELTGRLTKTTIMGAGTNGGKLKDAIRFSPIDSMQAMDEGDLGADADKTDEAQLSSLNDPYYNTVNEYKKQNKLRQTYNMGIKWNIVKGLDYQFRGSYDFDNNYTDNIWLNKTGESSSNGGQPVAKRTDEKGQSWSIQNTLSYRFRKDKHDFNAMVGQEMVSRQTNNMQVMSKYYPIDFTADQVLSMWNYGTPQPTYTTIGEPSRTASYFGRVNYTYNDRYTLSFTARADGTNVLAPDQRWGFFPGVAAAWRISDEEFMESTRNWLDNLKLRVSYGAVGNARVSSYWRQDYSIETSANKQYYLNETVQTGMKPGNTLRNENLTWETKLSSNIGLDATFFGGRLNATLELYKDVTKDLILRMDLPSYSGYQYQYQNLGCTSNKGVELTLNGTLVNTKDFYLSANFNIAFNKNVVEKLDGTATSMIAQSGWAPDVGRDDYRVFVGEPIGQIYGFEVEGFYTFDDFTFDHATNKWVLNDGVASDFDLMAGPDNFGPGYIKLKDQNGDGVIDADNDRVLLGCTQPKHYGGFGLNAQWLGFDMAAMFNWSYGGKVYNAMKILASTYTNRRYNNISTEMSLDKRWTIIDPETGANVMYGNLADPQRFREINQNASIWSPLMGRTVVTDWAVEDNSFLRFSNLTIGYTLPVSLTQKFGVRNLRIYATASNLFCWTKYSGQDPEVSTQRSTPMTPNVDYSAYPKARNYVFGINVTF